MTEQFATHKQAGSTPTGKEFFNYYWDPHPERAPDALVDCIERGMFRDPDNVVWYLFARIARDHQWLVRRYETLFRKCPIGRQVILKILEQCGDLETRRFLLELIGDPQFASLQAAIEKAVHGWPAAAIDPLSRPVRAPADLDLLWCEFRATGSTAPVLRIIDVFERPDRIRGKLEDWLREGPPEGAARFLWTSSRKRTCRKLRMEAAIVCDLDRLDVLSPQDLDCHSVMQDMVLNRERAKKIAKLLPFDISGDEAYLWFKGAALWSLASHAREHRVVFELCETEGVRRRGRCRTLLLELVEAFADTATFPCPVG